ncbi:MAG TPA: septum formation initiator family protein [Candidatus Paceibacterota bacterium]|nr:septum formation initiator family protein [Candidatus Paceibacterota bacterium]
MIAKKKKIKKHKRFQNVFFPVLIGVFLFAIISFFVVSNLQINHRRGELTDKINELKKDINLLEERNEQLKMGITKTESDAYWEEKLREQGYKKPGEEAIVIIPPEENNNSGSEEKNIFSSFWQNLSNFWNSFIEKIGF